MSPEAQPVAEPSADPTALNPYHCAVSGILRSTLERRLAAATKERWLDIPAATQRALVDVVAAALLEHAMGQLSEDDLAAACANLTERSTRTTIAREQLKPLIIAAADASRQAGADLVQGIRAALLESHEQTCLLEETRARAHALLGYLSTVRTADHSGGLIELGHSFANEDAKRRMQLNVVTTWDNVMDLLRRSGLWATAWTEQVQRGLSYDAAVTFFSAVHASLSAIDRNEHPDAAVVESLLRRTIQNVDESVREILRDGLIWKPNL